jgi:hypothetical protein
MKKNSRVNNSENEVSPDLTLDHIYIIAVKSTPEFQFLKDSGFFISDIIVKQPGFGTSGRTLYFQNFYIELYWIENQDVFMKSIMPHYKNNKGVLVKIKMGVAFVNNSNSDNNSLLTFDKNNFCWDMMIPGNCLKLTEIKNVSTPMYFIQPDHLAFNKNGMQRNLLKPLVNHKNKIRRLTNAKMFFADRELSKAEKYLEHLDVINFQTGAADYFELEFDHHIQGKEINLIRELSINIKY